ncbi:hypothetical protein CC1G_04729 [Coprinopsis cinerea okayama7|uniref:Uncharacterized protein n=1 Tax=Coprinopsis cinerea (strain Okayama-7 / 130 / ATCC MYA-4618 / FGSC 9003) TaxID=240176 RepID=A8P2C4_COPC7|nr:hypothetical protein CC1G_04729 [Coprinopsis cinerea okayama7\|eukprot:XP_001838285.1 hypothetical protein CC1G_04729 [Coprinopsis cinerea okayama7\
MPIGPLTRRSLKSWVEVKPELLVAVDIGTTYSAVSLCIRTYGPNGSSNVEVITSWPKQALKNIKEPSVVCYDLDGTLNPEGFGSGAFDDADVVDQIDQGKLIKVQWWKLAFRPDHLPPIAGLEDYLPDFNKGLNINVETVLRDYLMLDMICQCVEV